MKRIEKHYTTDSLAFEELAKGLNATGKYSYLQIILSKHSTKGFGENFLMVTRNAFSVVKLLDLDFADHHVHLLLQDMISGIIKQFSLNIDDTFRFFLISWRDILAIAQETEGLKGRENT